MAPTPTTEPVRSGVGPVPEEAEDALGADTPGGGATNGPRGGLPVHDPALASASAWASEVGGAEIGPSDANPVADVRPGSELGQPGPTPEHSGANAGDEGEDDSDVGELEGLTEGQALEMLGSVLAVWFPDDKDLTRARVCDCGSEIKTLTDRLNFGDDPAEIKQGQRRWKATVEAVIRAHISQWSWASQWALKGHVDACKAQFGLGE